jgi:spermidine/putrescine transport system ATP-binding protein
MSSTNKVIFLGIEVKTKYKEFNPGEKVDLMLRPEDFIIKNKGGKLNGTIISSLYKGLMYEYTIKVSSKKVRVHSITKYAINKEVSLD